MTAHKVKTVLLLLFRQLICLLHENSFQVFIASADLNLHLLVQLILLLIRLLFIIDLRLQDLAQKGEPLCSEIAPLRSLEF